MQVKKYGWKTVREIVNECRTGINTDHFHAVVSWPQGYDGNDKIEIMMTKPFVASSREDYGIRASRTVAKEINEELDELKHRIDSLIFAVGCYAIDRELNHRQNQAAG